ncbi:hypothetical protein G6L78_31935 [Agrobacterium rhizogenes]|nr:hypothetical protein [Rhizobium rhizogenes]
MSGFTCDPFYRPHRFLDDGIAHVVWLCLRLPLNMRMGEDLLAGQDHAGGNVGRVGDSTTRFQGFAVCAGTPSTAMVSAKSSKNGML